MLTAYYFAWYIILITGFLYTILIISFAYGWLRTKKYERKSISGKTFVSVLIPARNEEENIGDCINDILQQDFPEGLFEIIVVDDFSADSTARVVEDFCKRNDNIRLIRLSGENCKHEDENYVRMREVNKCQVETPDTTLNETTDYQPEVADAPNLWRRSADQPLAGTDSHRLEKNYGKKRAIYKGIENSKGNFIVTTDADCRMNNEWLSTIVSFYEEFKPKMIVCPVVILEAGIFSRIQSLEFLSLVGSSAGAIGINRPIMCNGANLAYEKDAFLQFNDTLNNKFASGDDVLFMLKLKKKLKNTLSTWGSNQILFLKSKNAVVYTKAQPTFKSFIQQRRRWVSKSKTYKDFDIIFTALIVFFTNFFLFCSFTLMWFIHYFGWLFLALFILKTLVDFLFLSIISSFFNKIRIRTVLILFLPVEFLYFFYVSFIGIFGNIGRFKWKGRYVK